VTEVRENSPAKRAGLLPGDVIELLNGSVVAGASARKLDKDMGSVQAGDTVKMTVLRSGKKVAISMVAGET
jgi:S1-C subfamily serine protease